MAMWSAYFLITVRRRSGSRNSSASDFRCSVTVVPRAGRSIASISYSDSPVDDQRQPSPAGAPARRVSTVTRSATMKAE